MLASSAWGFVSGGVLNTAESSWTLCEFVAGPNMGVYFVCFDGTIISIVGRVMLGLSVVCDP